MEALKRKVTKFRNAINIAKKRGELDWHPMFRKFPNECCDLTCDLLGQYLAEDGIMTYQINGVNKYDTAWHHVWLLTNDGILIDITEDQFVDRLVSVDDIDPVHVGKEGIVHGIFSFKRKYEPNTKFVNPNDYTGFGGVPSPRQVALIKLNNIIRQYL